MYQNIARFYDAIHAQLTEDIPFVLELAVDAGGPILDLGCGTGRLLRPLAANGFEVVGVDDSAEMLARVDPTFNTYQADILTLDLPQKAFSLAIFSHNTAHHFAAQQLDTVLGNVRAHLREAGWLLLDLANPYLMERVEDEAIFEVENVFKEPDTQQVVEQYSRWHNDVAAQILQVEWQYRLEDGTILDTATAYHYIGEEALHALLVKNGFAEMMLFGDYDSNPFDEESQRMLVIAR
jgi:SAM-dependent methyltransferase